MDYANEKKEMYLMHQIYAALASIAKSLEKKDCNNSYLTAGQCMVILAVQLSPNGEISMVDIAKKIGVTKQNINQLIPLLEKKGYVSRSACNKDKRTVNIKTTDSGISAMLEYVGAGASFMTKLFNKLNESEMETLWLLLRKIQYNYKDFYSDLANDIHQLFESEYSELLIKILEEYKKGKN